MKTQFREIGDGKKDSNPYFEGVTKSFGPDPRVFEDVTIRNQIEVFNQFWYRTVNEFAR